MSKIKMFGISMGLAVVILALFALLMNPTDIIIFFTEFLIGKFGFIPVSIIMVSIFVGAMWYSSWSIDIHFKQHIWPAIKDDPNAVAHWHGKRLQSIAFVCGCSVLGGAIIGIIPYIN